MKILLKAFSSNDHWNGEYDFAIVEIDRKLVEKIASRFRLLCETATKDPEVRALEFESGHVSFYRAPEEDGGIDDRFLSALEKVLSGSANFVVLPDDLDLSFLYEEAEETPDMTEEYKFLRGVSDVVVFDAFFIHREEFCWVAYLEETEVSTASLSLRSSGLDKLL